MFDLFNLCNFRTKQGELLSNLHELQSEKTAIEQQLKTEDCLVKATEADLKVWMSQLLSQISPDGITVIHD